MSFVKLRNRHHIGDYLKPYIVAELNTSHFGDIEIAQDMIRQAKAAGCDCVKFQSWSDETLYCKSYYKDNSIAKKFIKKFSLDNFKLKDLSKYANEHEIDFSSTPYSIEEASFLVEDCNVPFVKIASMELNNLPYLRQLGELAVPLVLSTGMGNYVEIKNAVRTIEETGNQQIIILHCTSVYPSDPSIIRLQNIAGLRIEFPQYPVGFSDHSIGLEIPAASIALGACMVEKHFTLDSKRMGMDNQMATEPEEMAAMVRACHNVHAAMGGAARVLSSQELEQISKMRRSVVSKRSIPAGVNITMEDIEFKRPGTGISPSDMDKVLGRQLILPMDVGEIFEMRNLTQRLDGCIKEDDS